MVSNSAQFISAFPLLSMFVGMKRTYDVSRWKNFWTSLILIFRQLICSDRNNIPVIGNYSQIVNLSKAYINRKSKRLFEQATYLSVKTRSCHVHVTFYSWRFRLQKKFVFIFWSTLYLCVCLTLNLKLPTLKSWNQMENDIFYPRIASLHKALEIIPHQTK